MVGCWGVGCVGCCLLNEFEWLVSWSEVSGLIVMGGKDLFTLNSSVKSTSLKNIQG